MEESPPQVPSLTKLGKLANGRKFDDLEPVWLAAVESGAYPANALVTIPGQVGRLGAQDRAEALLWVLLSSLEEREGPAAALDAARLAAEQVPKAEGLRAQIERLFGAVYGEFDDLGSLLDWLHEQDLSLAETVETADRYLKLHPGSFVTDPNFLVPGKVVSLKAEGGVLTVLFEKRHQDYGRLTLGKLTSLPPDHFGSLLIYNPEEVRTVATERPLDFLLMALRAEKDGRLGYRDLKGHVRQLLGEKEWAPWWKRVRPLLLRASRIEVSGGSQPTLKLLRQDSHYEDRLKRQFDSAADDLKRLTHVLAYLVENPGEVVPDSAGSNLLIHFGNSVAKAAVAHFGQDPVLSLGCLAVHGEVAARGVAVAKSNPQAGKKVLAKIENPSILASNLPETVLEKTLAYLRSVVPDRWPAVWGAVFTRAGRRICDSIARTLIETGNVAALQEALTQVVQRPTSFPDALCWLWRARQTSAARQILIDMETVSAADIVTGLLNLVDATGRLCAVSSRGRHRRVLEMARQTLAVNEARPVSEVFAAAEPAAAAQFKPLVVNNDGLTAAGRGQLSSMLRLAHPDLFIEEDRPWEEEHIFTTEAGLLRQQAVLEKILQEDIPAVAKQIGEAAAFGDLSENAEFTAALEKRDQLTSRGTRMQEELQRAKVITPDMGSSPHVNIGCRVHAQNLTADTPETYTFLGPWDTDASQRILNYRAPLALAFMGKKVGDEVVFDDGEQEHRWQILAIEPAD